MKNVSLIICVLLLWSCAVQQPSGWASGKTYTIPESEMGQYQDRLQRQVSEKKPVAQPEDKKQVTRDSKDANIDIFSVAGKTIFSESDNGNKAMQWQFTDSEVTMINGQESTLGDYQQEGKKLNISIAGRKFTAFYDGSKITFPKRNRAQADYTPYQKPYADDCIQHDGYYRCWYIHVPKSLNGPVPLLLDMHGFGGNAEGQKRLTGFDLLADTEGFIVVWPQGMNASWNAGPGCCGHSVTDGVDDVGV